MWQSMAGVGAQVEHAAHPATIGAAPTDAKRKVTVTELRSAQVGHADVPALPSNGMRL